jgi:lysophospholipase L1-like esterase
MHIKAKAPILGLILAAAAPLACSSGSASGTGSGTGGSATGGSRFGTGGAMATGGNLATGGKVTMTGGSVSSGGVVATGGTSQPQGAGGKTATTAGGASGFGGTSSTGGSISSGGATSAGGRTGAGGATSAGGNQDASPDARADVGAADSFGQDAVVDVDTSKKITVWMSGDSTMAGATCDGGGWGDQVGALFNSDVTVQNLSVAGRSIQTWLYEKNVSSTMGSNGECTLSATTYSTNWNTMLDASKGMKAGDYLLIEFGINDGDSTCPRHVGGTLFETYLTTMAKAAHDRGTQAIFLTSTSAIECSGNTAKANRGFGTETKAAGTAASVPVIDMTALTAALYTSIGLCPNSSDYTSTTSKVGQFFCEDHTHFEAAGAKQIAQTAAKALKDQGIGLAAYLK